MSDDINAMGDVELVDALIEAAKEVAHAWERWDESGAKDMQRFVDDLREDLLRRLGTKEKVG